MAFNNYYELQNGADLRSVGRGAANRHAKTTSAFRGAVTLAAISQWLELA